MIDNKILKSLTSTFNDPSFSLLVKGFKQNNECNKDELKIILEQTNPNLYKLLEIKDYAIDELLELLQKNGITPESSTLARARQHINSIVEKELILDSNINIQENKSLSSEINGYISIKGYGSTPQTTVIGEIKSRIVNITTKDYPTKVHVDKIRIRNNVFILNIPNNVDDIVIKINDEVQDYVIEDKNLYVFYENIHQGNHTFQITYNNTSDLSEKTIEVFILPIDKKIDLDFENSYPFLPSVFLTVDARDTNLYKNYNTIFKSNYKCNSCGHIIENVTEVNKCPLCESTLITKLDYTGVILNFNSLKRRASYPDINIAVLGVTND